MIELLQQKIRNDLFELSGHALKRSVERSILLDEIVESILSGEVIESYPDDRYGPTCLIFGYTQNNRPFTMQLPISSAYKNYYGV